MLECNPLVSFVVDSALSASPAFARNAAAFDVKALQIAKVTPGMNMLSQNVSVPSVIGLIVLSIFTRSGSVSDPSFRALTLAAQMAQVLKLNTEEGIAALTPNEVDREALRCIWWSIKQLTSLFACSCHQFRNFIADTDSRLRLPRDAYTAPVHPLDQMDATEFAIMSSTAWHIPSLPGHGILANLIMLEKIAGRTGKFCASIIDGKFQSQVEIAEARAHLDTSLDAWFQAAPAVITNCIAHFAAPEKRQMTPMAWRPLFARSLFHYARINLWRHTFVENIRQSQSLVVSSRAFGIVTQAARDLADNVASLIIKYDSAGVISPFMVVMLYTAIVVLLMALKLPTTIHDTTRNVAALSILTDAIKRFQHHWNVGVQELDIIELVAKLPDVALIAAMHDTLSYPKGNGRKIIDDLTALTALSSPSTTPTLASHFVHSVPQLAPVVTPPMSILQQASLSGIAQASTHGEIPLGEIDFSMLLDGIDSDQFLVEFAT
eukprot:jgi/Hompol1/5158/HPOL_004178-RA